MTSKSINLLRKLFQKSSVHRIHFINNKKKYNESIIKNRHQNLYRNFHNRKFHTYTKPQLNIDNPNQQPNDPENDLICICIIVTTSYIVNKLNNKYY